MTPDPVKKVMAEMSQPRAEIRSAGAISSAPPPQVSAQVEEYVWGDVVSPEPMGQQDFSFL